MFRSPRLTALRTTVPPVLQPARRPFSGLLRRTVQPGDNVQVQSVRFKPAGFTPRRLATFALYAGCTIGYMRWLLQDMDVQVEVTTQERYAEEHARVEQEEGEDEEESEFADEDSTFIPLTWAKKLPRTFYKGSDPEWQEFIKIAKDSNKHKALHKELVGIVYDGTLQHPAIARQIGKDPKVGKVWLDINFPDGPPQEYVRTGIEIADDFIALSDQRLSPEQYHRTKRALWPTAAFNGLWATTRVLFDINYWRVMEALGIERKPEPGSREAKYQHMLQMIAAHQGKQAGISKAQTDPGAGAGAVASSESGGMKSSSAQSSPNDSAPAQSTEVPDGRRLPWTVKAPLPSAAGLDMPIAMHVFGSAFARSWMPEKMEPPRGTFVVSGLVEVKGQRARVLFDIQAFYDPKANRYVVVNASVRNMKRWRQSPRGGH